MKSRTAAVMLLGLVTLGWARDWRPDRDDVDRELPPWIQYYNKLKGSPKLLPWQQDEPESLNVRCVGKWGRGPAARVTGRDSLVYLALGSEVAVFNCVNASDPRIINEIQCRYVVDRPILVDTILYAVLQGGVEVFSVANPARVTRIRYLPISAVDMCIRDSLAYTIDADSFKVYRIVSPDSFLRVGAVADSGYYIFADQGFAYLCDRWGIYIIDARNPASPHRATTLTSAQGGAAWVDDGYCYYTTTNPGSVFVVANVTDPYHPTEVGRRDGIASYELYKLDGYVYMPNFAILEVFNPSQPGLVSTLTLPEGSGTGVWTRSPYSHSFVAATYGGMASIDITDPVHPVLDTMLAGADVSLDFGAASARGLIANQLGGVKILDLLEPTRPLQIGSYDTASASARTKTCSARDSLACLVTQNWLPANFRVVSISDPETPALVGWCHTQSIGEASLVRDSMVYVAEDYHFEIFSIANPRAPRLVGSCGLPNSSWGLFVRDSLAFVANLTALKIVNVANPASPRVIGTCAIRSLGIAVEDSIAYVGGDDGLYSLNVSDPTRPTIISNFSIPDTHETFVGLAAGGSRAFIGTSSYPLPNRLRVIDISDPTDMRGVGFYIAPDRVRRVSLDSGLIYAACNSGGVCIFETTSTTAASEAHPGRQAPELFDMAPNPASGFLLVTCTASSDQERRVKFYDTSGQVALTVPYAGRGRRLHSQPIDISTLPDGCYFVRIEPAFEGRARKLIKTTRR